MSDFDNVLDFFVLPVPTKSHIEISREELAAKLRHILYNCLSAQLKRYDAICSSETHLNTAIAELYSLIPGYSCDDKDHQDVLDWAVKEMELLRGL